MKVTVSYLWATTNFRFTVLPSTCIETMYTLTIRKHNLPQYDHLKLVDYTDRQLVDLREDVTSYTYTMRYTGKDSNLVVSFGWS